MLKSLPTMKSTVILFVLVLVILILIDGSLARRGRKIGEQMGGFIRSRIPLTPLEGKWRDPGAYYMNPKGARITNSSQVDLKSSLGHNISFICDAKGSPRPQVTWFRDGVELNAHWEEPHSLQIEEWYFGDEEIKSKMEIDPATQLDGGIYECQADNMYAVDRRTFRTDFVEVHDLLLGERTSGESDSM